MGMSTEEARAAIAELRGQADAYPGIVGGRQWQQLTLYDLSGKGWNERLCAKS